MEDNFSSNEDEIDVQELEVALYSQIHFDPVSESFAQNTRDVFPAFAPPSYQVGVQSFVSKVKTKKKKALLKKAATIEKSNLFGLDFIGFSDNDVSSAVNDSTDIRIPEKCLQKHIEKCRSHSDKNDSGVVEEECKQSPPVVDKSFNNSIQQCKREDPKERRQDISCIVIDDDDDDDLLAAMSAFENSENNVSNNLTYTPCLAKDARKYSDEEEGEIISNIDPSPTPTLSSVKDKVHYLSESEGEIISINDLSPTPSLVSVKDKKKKAHYLSESESDGEIVSNTDPSPTPASGFIGRNYSEEEGEILSNGYPSSTSTVSLIKNNKNKKKKKKKQCIDPADEPMPSHLFSFTITKAPKVIKKPPSLPPEEDAEIVIKVKNVEKRPQTATNRKAKTKKLSKLEGFLKFSVSEGDEGKNLQSKRLSKQEAAVQQRKPPVILRVPPTETVKYHQHSDTNTDYSSESEASQPFSPWKSRKVRNVSSTKMTEKQILKTKGHADSSSDSSDDDVVSPKVQPTTKLLTSTSRKDELVIESSDTEGDSDEEEVTANKENQDIIEKEDSSSSTGSNSHEEEDDENVDNFALDFNLTGGIEALLKTDDKEESDPKWAIDEQDKMARRNVLTNRYFNPKKIKCRNCNEEGHIAIACTKERKIVCILCGTRGHHLAQCQDAICYNCLSPGHRYTDCPKPKQNRYQECERCWMRGHSKDVCPDLWRQYHLTIGLDSKRIVKAKVKQYRNIYCFNCGRKGHLGYECRSERMSRFVHPFYPYVAEYDGKTNIKNKKDEDNKEERQHKRDYESTKGKKRKAQKIDDTDRKASKRKRYDDADGIVNFKVQIEQQKSTFTKGSKRQDSMYDRENSDRSKSWNRKDSFISGSTMFQYQEPSDPKYSQRKNTDSQRKNTDSQRKNTDPQRKKTDSQRKKTDSQRKNTDSKRGNNDSLDFNRQANTFHRSRGHDSYENKSEYSMERNNSNQRDVGIKGQKSRKGKQKKGKEIERYEELVENDIALWEDYNQHQVSQNEWWKMESVDMNDFEDHYFDFTKSEASDTSTKKNRLKKKKQQSKSNFDVPSISGHQMPQPHSRSTFKRKKINHHSSHDSSSHEYPYHHHHYPNHQNYFNEYEEDYISLDSRIPQYNGSRDSHYGSRKNTRGWSEHDRFIADNGFKARDWIMSMY